MPPTLHAPLRERCSKAIAGFPLHVSSRNLAIAGERPPPLQGNLSIPAYRAASKRDSASASPSGSR